ncbi:MAG: hypothetical protein KQH53_15415 [Desulfarculaceae bacterium]|nr:hypothetical protein [Desulfarculaceae bacterium]
MSRWHTLALVFVCFLSGLGGDYFSSVVFAKQDDSGQPRDRLVARSIVIVDKHNQPRAGFGFDPDGFPIFFIKDDKGKVRLMLGCASKGPSVFLYDKKEAINLFLQSSDDGSSSIGIMNSKRSKPRLVLAYAPDKASSLGLYDENNSAKAYISVSGDDSSIALLRPNRKAAIALTNRENQGSVLGIWNSNNQPAVSLAVKGDKPGLFMYQQPRTGLLFNTAGGRPALALMNNGTPIWSATGDVPPALDMPLSDNLLKELTR